MLFDVETFDKITRFVNSKSRRPRGEDETLDALRDLLHMESYTA